MATTDHFDATLIAADAGVCSFAVANELELLIAELQQELDRLRSSPAHIAFYAIGTFVETLDAAVGQLCGYERGEQNSIDRWHKLIPKNQAVGEKLSPSFFSDLKTAYDWRNKATHPAHERHTLDQWGWGTADRKAQLVFQQARNLGRILPGVLDEAIFAVQSQHRSLYLARMLELAFINDEVDWETIRQSLAAYVDRQPFSFASAKSRPEVWTRECIRALAAKANNDQVDHVVEAAKTCFEDLRNEECPHLRSFVSKWAAPSDSGDSRCNALRVSVERVEGGALVVSRAELVGSRMLELEPNPSPFEPGQARRVMGRFLNSCKKHVRRQHGEKRDLVIVIECEPEDALAPYEGAQVGGLFRACSGTAVAPLVFGENPELRVETPASDPRSGTRDSILLGNEVVDPDDLRDMMNDATYFFGMAASVEVDGVPAVVRGYDEGRVFVLSRDRRPAALVESLFEEEDKMSLAQLLKRVDELRGAGRRIVVLWDEEDIQYPAAMALGDV